MISDPRLGNEPPKQQELKKSTTKKETVKKTLFKNFIYIYICAIMYEIVYS